jgi:hypothetical protein
MIIDFETQCYENYGYPHQDYWKTKGTNLYRVTGAPNDLTDDTISNLYAVFEKATGSFTESVYYHAAYADSGAPTLEWITYVPYEDVINALIELETV